MNATDFHCLLFDAGFHIPKSVQACLELMGGKLDCLGKPWQGFRLTLEAIESPDGDFIYAYEVRAIAYVYLAAGLERTRLCTMLKNTTPIHRCNRCPKPKKPTLSAVTDTQQASKMVAPHRRLIG